MQKRGQIGRDFELLAAGRQVEPGEASAGSAIGSSAEAPAGSDVLSSDDDWQQFLVPQMRSLDLAEQETLPIGSLLDGKYKILGIAGKGGMGVVYAARHVHLSRIVAVKMLRKEYCTDDLVFRRFQKEAQAASLLHHPNIVKVHDFVMKRGVQAYLVMDFLDGTNLLREFSREHPLPLDRFHNIFVQACDALEHAHKFGLVHRDIKPSNLLLTARAGQQDCLTIVDFGLVKLMSMLDDQRLTTTNTLIGSPLYMSPEQCTRLQVDHRSDIYSLGCTMYEALTGYLPLHGETPLETFCKHVTEEPLPLNKRNPNAQVPPQLERVILKALSKNPRDRQQTMADLKEELEHSLAEPDTVSTFKQLIQVGAGSSTVSSLSSTTRLTPCSKQRSSKWILPALFLPVALAALPVCLLTHKNLPANDRTAIPAAQSAVHSAAKRPAVPGDVASKPVNSQEAAKTDQFATGFPDVAQLEPNPNQSQPNYSNTKKTKKASHRGYHWVRYYHYFYYR